VEAGPSRPDWYPKRRRDLSQRQPDVVVEDDDRALLGGQPAKRVLQEVAVREVIGLVGLGRLESDDAHARHLCTFSTRQLIARPDQQAPDPCVEPRGIAELRQVPLGSKEGLLYSVRGTIGVAQDAVRDHEQSVDRCCSDLRKRISVAPFREFHELFHGRPSAAMSAAFIFSGGRSAGNVQPAEDRFDEILGRRRSNGHRHLTLTQGAER
jgi:hypothetical protein